MRNRFWALLMLLLGLPVQAQPTNETAAEGRYGSKNKEVRVPARHGSLPSPLAGEGMGMRGDLPHPLPSPGGRGEVSENLHFARNEGEGETARLISINRNNSTIGRSLPRESPVPGGIVIIPVAPDCDPAPEVYFDNRRVLVMPHAGKWQAVVGLPLALAPGPQSVQVGERAKPQREFAFTVRPMEYAEQRLTVKERRMVEPSADDLVRIAQEQSIIRRVFAAWTDQPFSSLQFTPPAQGRISSVFGLRRYFNNQPRQPHSGLDIAGPVGTPVMAPLAGVVAELGEYFFNGKTVFIDHGQGLISMFNHLSQIAVKRGARVGVGDKIGEIGMTGRVTGPHLHWTVSLNDSRVDPALFLPEHFQKNENGQDLQD